MPFWMWAISGACLFIALCEIRARSLKRRRERERRETLKHLERYEKL